ncbi:MAG: hypothetical protein Q9M91_01220 [Candidatus Dojkabacteria bacterium]|nr:hypothetical protein [Candidatus Dojkabacteria bacterium]
MNRKIIFKILFSFALLGYIFSEIDYKEIKIELTFESLFFFYWHF